MAEALRAPLQAMRARRGLLPYAGLLLLGLIWGSSFLFIKLAVVDVGPQALVFGRCLTASAALALVLAVRGRSPLTATNRQRMPHYLAMALLNSVIPWLGLAYGELAVSSGLTSILNSTTPLWTALLAWWLSPAERLRPLSGTGVVLGFLGTAVLILPDLRIGGARATLVGSGCVLVAALSYALAALYQRWRLRDASPFDAGFWQMALTVLVMLPLAVTAVASARLGLASIMSVIALGVGASCAGILLYYWLLNRLGAAGASTVNYLLPATAVLWGVLFLHETVTLLLLGGAVIILGGVLLTSLPRSRPA